MSRLSDRGLRLPARWLSVASVVALLASIAICAAAGIAYIKGSGSGLVDAMTQSAYDWYWIGIANIVGIEMVAVGSLMLAWRDRRGDIEAARHMTRVLVVSLIATALLSIVINGVTWFLAAYVTQLVCVVAYQVDNDPNLGESVEWVSLGVWQRIRSAFAAPFSSLRLHVPAVRLPRAVRLPKVSVAALRRRRGHGSEEPVLVGGTDGDAPTLVVPLSTGGQDRLDDAIGGAGDAVAAVAAVGDAADADGEVVEVVMGDETDAVASAVAENAYRNRYIPLNAFNLLFLFLVGSLVGCVLEDVWHMLTEGFWQERAGLVWGPLTPIYGCGALAMTVALNRFWRAAWWKVMAVAGVVGCAVEYVTSWYLEAAVGVVAWDYTGTVGSVNGRVNLFFMLVWGLLGLVWVKLLLPVIMRLVDAIPVRRRAVVTTIVFAWLLADVVLTTVAMDGYSKRHAGIEPRSGAEQWVAANYDDEWMSRRFEKMEFGDQPVHVRIEREAGKIHLF